MRPLERRFLPLLLPAATLHRVSEAVSAKVGLPPLSNIWTFLAYDIGLEPAAAVDIDLQNDRPSNDTYVMLLSHAQWLEWHQVAPQTLPGPGGKSPGRLNSYLTSSWRAGIYDSMHTKFCVEAPAKDRYYLGVLNAQRATLKLSGKLNLVNPGGDHLRLQDRHVPVVLLWTSLLFLVSCLLVTALLANSRRRGRTTVHVLMVATIFLKSVVLALERYHCLQVSVSGSDSGFGEIGWQLVDKVQTIVELMLFLLIALGWKFLRSSLNLTEVRFAVGISVISFYLGVFEVACTTSSTCSGYQLSRYILHSLCYLVVIVAMNVNLQMIHSQLLDAPASTDAGKLYRKLRAYRAFRWAFLAFIVAPTAELWLKVSVVPWDASWIYVLLQQLRTWAIYACLVVAFRPEPAPLRVFELTRGAWNDDELEATLGGPGRLVSMDVAVDSAE